MTENQGKKKTTINSIEYDLENEQVILTGEGEPPAFPSAQDEEDPQKNFEELQQMLRDTLEKNVPGKYVGEELDRYVNRITNTLFIIPFIQAVLEDRGLADELDFETVLSEGLQDEGGSPKEDGQAAEILKEAIRRQAEQWGFEKDRVPDTAPIKEEIRDLVSGRPSFFLKPIKDLTLAVDKVNSNIWGPKGQLDTNGQIALAIDMAGQRDKEAIVLYSLSFEEMEDIEGLKLNKSLNAYDRRCHDAAWSLYLAGNEYFTASDLHRCMGNTGSPNQKQVAKIRDSMRKMRTGIVSIDNSKELAVNKNYPLVRYTGAVMPFEEVETIKNGKPAEVTYHILAEPPLGAFARGRQNITTIPRAVLESPINKTENTLAIENYLLQRVRQMENHPQHSKRILFASVFDNCGITEKMPKSRARDLIHRELEHFKKTGFIKNYTEEKDGVTITLIKTNI